MTTLLKNLLTLTLIVTLGGVLVLGSKFMKSYDRISSPTNFRSFTVQGDGKASGVPDIASFSFSVVTEGGTDVAALQSQNAEKMNKAIEFVTKQGVDKKDITTSQYSIQPQYAEMLCDYSLTRSTCPPPSIVGYTIRQSVFIKVRDFKLISPLLSGVVTNGANSVSGLQFTIDDSTTLENTARTAAIKKAQEKAENIAKAGGFKLGKLLEISEGYAIPYYRATPTMDMAVKSESTAVAPTIEPGSQEVTINVTLRYEID